MKFLSSIAAVAYMGCSQPGSMHLEISIAGQDGSFVRSVLDSRLPRVECVLQSSRGSWVVPLTGTWLAASDAEMLRESVGDETLSAQLRLAGSLSDKSRHPVDVLLTQSSPTRVVASLNELDCRDFLEKELDFRVRIESARAYGTRTRGPLPGLSGPPWLAEISGGDYRVRSRVRDWLVGSDSDALSFLVFDAGHVGSVRLPAEALVLSDPPYSALADFQVLSREARRPMVVLVNPEDLEVRGAGATGDLLVDQLASDQMQITNCGFQPQRISIHADRPEIGVDPLVLIEPGETRSVPIAVTPKRAGPGEAVVLLVETKQQIRVRWSASRAIDAAKTGAPGTGAPGTVPTPQTPSRPPARPPSSSASPPPVSALAAIVQTNTSVLLQWASPGTEQECGAVAYEIRMGNGAGSSADWESGRPVDVGVLVPVAAGKIQKMLIQNLTSDQTYWFGIRTVDGSGRKSPIEVRSLRLLTG